MWMWLRNNLKLASTLGVAILIALIWFVGPLLGLASAIVRLISIIGVFVVWVAALMVGQLLAARAGGVLEKFLRRQADDAVMGASPSQRTEVSRLRQRMLSAIDTLKTSNIGKSRGKAALYELPWYMIIGHPAAGKSSAILHSGLTFPFGDKQAIQGVGGTRDCDWFFSTEGVLLDTAGRYSTQREDRPEWLEFLKLLKKYRSKAPVNGILVAISFPELLKYKGEEFAQYAHQVRERINEIDSAFGVKVPIYLVFTKIDLLGGFAQFFEDMSEEERNQVWGATLSHDQGSTFDARRVVNQQFDALYRGLTQLGAEKLANNRGNAKRPALFAFPIEFNAMRESIGKFVELLFQEDPYHSKPLLRGFYFTSALQEGTPRIAAGNRIASQFDLSKPGFNTAQLPTSNGFFLRNLFREVLFPDQFLITRQVRSGSSRMRMVALAAGLFVLAVITGGLTWSYVGNQKLITTAQEELTVARSLYESGELVDKLKAMQVLQLRIEQLYRYRMDGHPFALGMSLYQGEKIEKILRAEYFAGVKSLMLSPVAVNLERSLASLRTAPTQHNIPQPPPELDKPEQTPVVTPKPTPPVAKPKPTAPRSGLPVIPISGRLFNEEKETMQDAVFRSNGSRHFTLAQMPLVSRPGSAREAVQSVKNAATALTKNTSGVTQNVSNNPLEDGYNALKTYIMLQQKERMDVAHLSDQIPKYWRLWLEQNKGEASSDEINRLAQRVVAFYVSQIAEADLPLIENRPELIASSREVLRGAMHRLSAKERVYNELKARANTQFAPMTVGRMLNNNDLNLVAGSYAVPGAFTREAWDQYFRNSIIEASKGEVKGDDWVLAATTNDNLSKDGDVERNRAELESLYKADYAREWKKFLQGVAIQDFGTLENSVQVLSKLSDAQNSAIKLIFAKAAYETAWDNPSQLSKSIGNAKNSVIERTEKLILGSTSSQPQNANQLGEVGAKFATLGVMTSVGEGGRMPLSAYLDMLAKLKSKVAQIASSAEADGAARQLMQATLNGTGSELVEALTLVDGVLLANASEEAKEIARPLLVRPLMQTYAALIPPVEREINRVWLAEVFASWRPLASKYPFADSTNEAPMTDISKFLKPQEGILPKFIAKELAGLVTKRGDTLVPRTWANLGVNFSPAFLGATSRLLAAGGTVLQEGEGAKFELQPVPTPGLSETLIEIDGQTLRYRNGPQPWTSFTWPNSANSNAQGARIQVVSFAGVSTSVANFNGRLGLMRLLAQAKADNPSNPTVQLEWSFKGGRAVTEKALPNAFSDADSDVVRFNFRMVNGANPFSLSGLRRLGLPEKITH